MSIGFDIDIKFNCFSVILFGVVYVIDWVLGLVGMADGWYGIMVVEAALVF